MSPGAVPWFPAEQDGLDDLRARADAGDWWAARELAKILREHGDLDEAEQVLRSSALAGDPRAAPQLANLLGHQGRDAEAERLSRFGLTPDGSTARM